MTIENTPISATFTHTHITETITEPEHQPQQINPSTQTTQSNYSASQINPIIHQQRDRNMMYIPAPPYNLNPPPYTTQTQSNRYLDPMENIIETVESRIVQRYFNQRRNKISIVTMMTFVIFIITAYLLLTAIQHAVANAELDGLVDDKSLIAEGLFVTHYDCSAPKESRMYALTEIEECKIQLPDTETVPVEIEIFQRSFLRIVEATWCEIFYKGDRWHCGFHSHSTIDRTASSITQPLSLTGKLCEEALTTKKYPVYDVHWSAKRLNWQVQMEYEIEGEAAKSDGVPPNGNSPIDCDRSGYVNKYSFISRMGKANLTYNSQTGQILNIDNRVLLCKYTDGKCDSSTGDAKAYTWKPSKSCVLARIKKSKARMTKWTKHLRFFIFNLGKDQRNLGENEDVEKNYKLEILPNPEYLCNNPSFPLQPTNFESIFVRVVSGGFNLITGTVKKSSLAKTETADYQIDEEKSTDNTIVIKSTNDKDTIIEIMKNDEITDFWHPTGRVNMQVEYGSTIDFIAQQLTNSLRTSELQILSQICEIERTQMLIILAIASKHEQLAGFLLTGDRSKFMSTDGSIAYLYTCEEHRSPLRALDKCYDKIPIWYEGQAYWVDPVSRMASIEVQETPCEDLQTDYLYHMDLNEKDSWFTIDGTLRSHDPPEFFKPGQINYITEYTVNSAVNAGMYSKALIAKFWQRVQSNINDAETLTQFTKQLTKAANDQQGSSYKPGLGYRGGTRKHFTLPVFMDNLISPNFLYDRFTTEFGTLAYYLERAAVWFAAFLLVKFILEILTGIVRGFEIATLTRNTMSFGRVVLSSIFQIFYITALTNLFKKPDSTDDSDDSDNGHSQSKSRRHFENQRHYQQTQRTKRHTNDIQSDAEIGYDIDESFNPPNYPPPNLGRSKKNKFYPKAPHISGKDRNKLIKKLQRQPVSQEQEMNEIIDVHTTAPRIPDRPAQTFDETSYQIPMCWQPPIQPSAPLPQSNVPIFQPLEQMFNPNQKYHENC